MPELLSTVATPRVFVDRAKLQRNIAAMQARATEAGVRLRPHAKTHKSPVIARWQLDAGARGICCAKVGEAEVFAAAGIVDIRLPYPVSPDNASRILALLDRAAVSIIVDDLEVARAWSAAMVRAGRRLDTLVKVDVGFHRCGVDPESPATADTIRSIADLAGLRFLGLLSHAGHAYGAASNEDLEAIVDAETQILGSLAARLRETGTEVTEVSVGSTPTARFIGRQHGVTEMRPGNYVFFDRTQVGLGAATREDCAMGVVSTVVSRPAPNRVIFDAGSKTLSSDGLRGFGTHAGHGLVFPDLDDPHADPSIVLERLSEEHLTARVAADCRLVPGNRVRILPNHACVVTNLVDELLLVDGLTIVDRLSVAARGRIW
jgi:D-serine deaminase-like pyridoxal phosphate-dependent protein